VNQPEIIQLPPRQLQQKKRKVGVVRAKELQLAGVGAATGAINKKAPVEL
jgi:hypothetical protein